MKTFNLAKRWVYQLETVTRAVPLEWQKQSRAYGRADRANLKEVVKEFHAKLGVYYVRRTALDDAAELEMRRVRLLPSDRNTIELEAARVRDRNYFVTENIDDECDGYNPITIKLEDAWWNWLKSNWDARDDFGDGSDEWGDFVDAVNEAFEKVKTVKEEDAQPLTEADAAKAVASAEATVSASHS